MTRKRRLPKYCSAFVDRHGKERFTYRRKGAKPVYLREHPGTPARPSDEVQALIAGGPAEREPRAIPGTIDDLVSRFYRTGAFRDVSAETRRTRRGILERFRARHGAKRVATLTFEHVEAILTAATRKRKEGKRMVGGKVAARSLRKLLIRLFDLALKLDMVDKNPVRLTDQVKVPKGGYHTWTEEEIAQYQAKHRLGTKARLALEIMLWTGQRRGDAHRFGRRHMKGGRLQYRQSKTGKTLWLPAAPQLLAAIAAMPVTGTETFLVTDFGKPFTGNGFGNKMREWCDEAGLPHCTAHGLRKAMLRRLAEDGASQQGLKAAGGHSGDQEVALYVADADQARLADAALGRLAANLSNPGDRVRQSAPENDA